MWSGRTLTLQLQQLNFTERLRALLAAHPKVKPGNLEIEVLETSALQDVAMTSAVIMTCRAMGVRFALDDFGTGYSSLTYLKKLPADILKIDQSFVHDLLNDPDALAILEGVIGLAGAFQRLSIAEGLDSVEGGVMLMRLGCELAQGYAIAAPMPAADIPAWLSAWRPDPSWAAAHTVRPEQVTLLHAMVEHRSWMLGIEAVLNGAHSGPPPMPARPCGLNEWLAKALSGVRISAAEHDRICDQHHQLHAKAEELMLLHEQGKTLKSLKPRLAALRPLQQGFLESLEALIATEEIQPARQ